jgi:ABC-type dipeptide/oligopeptide/nickel transport system permease subunit
MKRFFTNKLFLVGFIIVIIFVFMGIFSNLITPYDPFQINAGQKLKAPGREFLLGTDEYGRDILSRIILSSRTTLFVVISSIAFSIVIGVIIGLIAGYYGGVTDNVLMRIQDGILAFPAVLLAILIMATVSPGYATLIFTIGIIYIPRFARLVRGNILVLKGSEFVKASIVGGGKNIYLMFKILLPNTLSVILVQASLSAAIAIIIEASLSYLGLGIQPPTPSWGLMLRAAQSYMGQAPWYVYAPGICIILIVFGFSLLGDGIREVTSPRLD